MMIYNDSVNGVSIHVNIPKVTPAMIQEAYRTPDKRLVIECVAAPTFPETTTKPAPVPTVNRTSKLAAAAR